MLKFREITLNCESLKLKTALCCSIYVQHVYSFEKLTLFFIQRIVQVKRK